MFNLDDTPSYSALFAPIRRFTSIFAFAGKSQALFFFNLNVFILHLQ